MNKIPERYWINQPSTLQPCHDLHGTNVLAIDDGNNMARAYFFAGPSVSVRIPAAALSPGWREKPQARKTTLFELAKACHNGACNPCGILRSLGEVTPELTPQICRESVELKIILGQLSFLLGESLGPSSGTVEAFEKILADELTSGPVARTSIV